MSEHRDRIQRLRRFCSRRNLDAYLSGCAANVRYLTGFTNQECWVLVTRRKVFFIADSRYELQARRELGESVVLVALQGSLTQTIAGIAASELIRSLYCEAAQLSVAFHRRLSETLGRTCRLTAGDDAVAQLRIRKTDGEIESIRRAIAITKQALQELAPRLKPGMSEQSVKRRLERLLFLHGAEAMAFDCIVAAGEHAAMPHAIAGLRKIKAGEPVIVDVGCVVNGYNSDLTRTFFLGTMTQHNKYYRLVKQAQSAAIRMIGPGIKISAVDRAAREVFRRQGVERYFGHALGHGVGLHVHEAPRISSKTREKFAPGMIVTIEPGLYIPSWGGVRIEDMVLVTEKGREILSI